MLMQYGICRVTLEEYSAEVKKLALTLLGKMGMALKMDNKEIEQTFGDGVQSMRMNYYPPCPEPDMAIGFTPHSDADALTILFQLNDTDGLQINKDGKWVSVNPLHNAFVVNLGDIMEVYYIYQPASCFSAQLKPWLIAFLFFFLTKLIAILIY